MIFGGFEFVAKSWHGNPFAEVKSLCNAHATSTSDSRADTGRHEPCPEIVAAGLRNPFRRKEILSSRRVIHAA